MQYILQKIIFYVELVEHFIKNTFLNKNENYKIIWNRNKNDAKVEFSE